MTLIVYTSWNQKLLYLFQNSNAYFRTYTSYQELYQQFSAKVDNEIGHHGQRTFGTASLFGQHHTLLGPYFSDAKGNEWPHTPLHKDPNSLENEFNNLLSEFTFEMSNGILKNVSLLDLPAFGSTISTLKIGLTKQYIWPTKLNFALLKSNPGVNVSTIMMSYKSLTEDWRNHMQNLGQLNSSKLFTSRMQNNQYLNFTQFIEADMKTFLTSIAGNGNSMIVKCLMKN